MLAFPFRYMVDIGSLILRGALKEFPKLKICFVEGSAAFVPWLMERLDMDIKAKERLGKFPHEFFNLIWVSAFAVETSLKYACDFWKDHNLTVGQQLSARRSIRHLEHRHREDDKRDGRNVGDRQRENPRRQCDALIRRVAGTCRLMF